MTRIHVSLQTADLDAAKTFYTALFGVGPDKVRDDYARFQPDEVPIALALMPGTPTPGAHHFGVKLADQGAVAAAAARLADRVQSSEEGATCCWAVQDKIWLTDPDGRAWEVYTVTDDGPVVAKSEASTCCVDDASCCA